MQVQVIPTFAETWKKTQKTRNNPGTTKDQAWHDLETGERPVSRSTVKPVWHHCILGEGADRERSPCSKIETCTVDWKLQLPTWTSLNGFFKPQKTVPTVKHGGGPKSQSQPYWKLVDLLKICVSARKPTNFNDYGFFQEERSNIQLYPHPRLVDGYQKHPVKVQLGKGRLTKY